MSQEPIEDLYTALRAGDEAALDALLPAIRGRLVRLARKRVGGEQADEVVQETLCTLWEKRDSVKEPSHLLPFLFQILRHKALNARYRARQNRRREGSEADLRAVPSNPAAVDPGLLLRAGELDRILGEAIRSCAMENPVWGRVLQLLRGGRSHEEVRREMGGIPMATVYTRIYRARNRLKEILRDDFKVDLKDWSR